MQIGRQGFTLLEVLISVAILAMISVLSWQSMLSMMGSQDIADDRDEMVHALRVTFDKLFTDLSQAFLVGQAHKGVKQASQPAFIGKKEGLEFASFAGRRYFAAGVGGDQCEIGYTLETSEEAPGTFTILRRQAELIDDKPEEGGKAYPLLSGVKQVQFEFYDPKTKEWAPEWDSTQISKHDRLPRAVRVSLTMEDREKGQAVGESTWLLEVAIPLYHVPLEF